MMWLQIAIFVLVVYLVFVLLALTSGIKDWLESISLQLKSIDSYVKSTHDLSERVEKK